MGRALAHVQPGNGRSRPAVLGMVDKSGAFLMYLDETAPAKYYRFSSESDLIERLVKENASLTKTADSLRAVVSGSRTMHLIEGRANTRTIAALYAMPETTVSKRLQRAGLAKVMPEGERCYYYDLAEVAVLFKALDAGQDEG